MQESKNEFLLFLFPPVLEVQFDPATYVVIEGGQVSLTAVLNFAADYVVMADFETRSGLAIGI